MTIGQRIKEKRESMHMSQEELAQKAGYKSRSSIHKIELGSYALPQNKIKAIADALQTTPGYIMGWDDAPINLLETIRAQTLACETEALAYLQALNKRETKCYIPGEDGVLHAYTISKDKIKTLIEFLKFLKRT